MAAAYSEYSKAVVGWFVCRCEFVERSRAAVLIFEKTKGSRKKASSHHPPGPARKVVKQ